jgi:hypothetical protein
MNGSRVSFHGSYWLLLILILLLTVAIGVSAQTGDSYDLTWSTIGSGGGHAEAGSYTLDGTIGQPIVGQVASHPYDLCVGFWCGGVTGLRLYLPLVLRSP